MTRILIADDHAIVRRGLKQIVEEAADMTIVGEASNSHEVLSLIHNHRYDVLVLDITMPGRSGLDILQDIQQLRPQLPILVLSMHSEDQFAARVLQAGASGYLPKESAPEELVKAIRKVISGGKYINPAQAEKLISHMGVPHNQDPHHRLSNREFEVMRRIASGKTVSQIAQEMKLSVKTISTYRARILEKMNLTSSAELTHYAIRNGLVD